MNEPIRYSVEEINCCFHADMQESHTGGYVTWEDYKSLQAEVEALMTNIPTSRLLRACREENARLRKAGEAMADEVSWAMSKTGKEEPRLVRDWKAAKEGNKTE